MLLDAYHFLLGELYNNRSKPFLHSFEILRANLNVVSEAHVSLLKYLLRGERSTVLLGDPSCFLVTTTR